MRFITHYGLVCIFSFICCTRIAYTREPELPIGKLKQEITDKLVELEKVYNNIQLVGFQERTSTLRKTGGSTRYDVSYFGNGSSQMYRLSAINESNGEEAYLDRIFLVNSVGTYVLRRNAPKSSYFVERTGPDKSLLHNLFMFRNESVLIPIVIEGAPIYKWINSPFCRVKSLKRHDDDHSHTLIIDIDHETPDDEARKIQDSNASILNSRDWIKIAQGPTPYFNLKGTVELDADHDYVILRYDVESTSILSKKPKRSTAEITYFYDRAHPVVKEAHLSSGIRSWTFRTTSCSFDPKPESEFALKSFQLGDFPIADRPKRIGYWIYLAFGVVLAVMIVVWAYYKRSTKDRSNPSAAPSTIDQYESTDSTSA